MLAQLRPAFVSLLVGLLLIPSAGTTFAADSKPKAAKSEGSDKNADAPATEKLEPAAPKLLPKAAVAFKTLNPSLTPLRDRVRKTLASLRQQPFNTQQNSCTDVLHYCHAFGCATMVTDNANSGQKVNGITCLCWDMACGGNEPMTLSDGHLTARVGYGFQDQPSQLAAVLALSHVPPEYPARSGKTVRTVADTIEYEKLTCRAGTDMSTKLVALAYYAGERSWKNNLGEEWTLDRVVAEELNRPLGNLPHAFTNRLLGISCALTRFRLDEKKLDGDRDRANQYVNEAIDFAYQTQNTDGSWGRASNRDYATAISSTGHMLEWLLVALPDSRLEEPQIVRAVECIDGLFNSSHYQSYLSSMTTREIAAAAQAARALVTYDERVFAPCDLPPGTPEAKPTEKSAAKPAQAR